MTKLTARQQAFVRAYAANGCNATQAAITAGYAKKTAKVQAVQTMKLPYIVDAIKAQMAPKIEHELATIEGRAAWLRSVVDGTKDAMPDDGGNLPPTGPKFTDKIKALELLGKMSGDYIERKHVTGEIQLGFTAYIPKKGSK